MKSSEILTRAAELVDKGDYYSPQYAIEFAFDVRQITTLKFFRSMIDGTVFKNRQHRVIALLLCAAIAADQGD